MKKRNISHSLPLCAQRILPIIQGVFDWNGELFACPFIRLEDKKKPFSLRTWINESKNGKHSLVFSLNNMQTIFLFADPINVDTWKKSRMHSMDRSFGIDGTSKVYLTGNHTVTIKNGQKTDIIKFVRKLTDEERLKIFPIDEHGNKLRHMIFKLSKPYASTYANGFNLEEVLKLWNEYLQKNFTLQQVA